MPPRIFLRMPAHAPLAPSPPAPAPLARAAAAALLLGASPAAAQLAVCNRTLEPANVAVARDVAPPQAPEAEMQVEGWWTVGPNQCANVVQGELGSRFLFVHVQDVLGRAMLDGPTPLCVAYGRFRHTSPPDCWPAGLIEAGFHEIDTLDSPRWTLFLAPPG